MSGKPYPEGVTKVAALLDSVAGLEEEIRKLRPSVDRCRSAETELANARIAIAKHLRDMDLESRGNHGWEGRMSWFLAEMRRQMTTPPASKPEGG